MGKLITRAAATAAIFALLDPGNRGRIAWNVVEMAWSRPLWGACAPFPAIKSGMCEIQA
jgi:hypothetical protein